MLEQRVDDLKKNIVENTALVERMIDIAIQGILENNRELLNNVYEMEKKANQYEIEIEDKCINIIAQFQPLAKDLRTIMTILKMGNDLERMGDHAVNLCQHAEYIIEKPQIKGFIDLPKMANITISMVKNSISSFIDENVNTAENVLRTDDTVDDLRDKIIRELIVIMSENHGKTETSIHLIEITRNLERIADLATNISEDTIYIVKGKNIKHSGGI